MKSSTRFVPQISNWCSYCTVIIQAYPPSQKYRSLTSACRRRQCARPTVNLPSFCRAEDGNCGQGGQYLGLYFPIARRSRIDSALTGVWADAVAKKKHMRYGDGWYAPSHRACLHWDEAQTAISLKSQDRQFARQFRVMRKVIKLKVRSKSLSAKFLRWRRAAKLYEDKMHYICARERSSVYL